MKGLFTVYSWPGKIGASLFNFIYFAWLGALGFTISSLQNLKIHKKKIFFAVCLFSLITINIFLELNSSFTSTSIYGIGLALIGGTFSYLYFKKSQALAKSTHLSATQILAVWFYLAIFVLVGFIPKAHIEQYFTIFNIGNLILLAFLSLIIPLYFSQKALEKITSEQHLIIHSLCRIAAIKILISR